MDQSGPRDTESLFGTGHGTFVAGDRERGTATATGAYRGMAPESEIVVYALWAIQDAKIINASVLDGARYIFGLAERKRLPARVVNYSGGTFLMLTRERKELEEPLARKTGPGADRLCGKPEDRVCATPVST